MTRWSDLPDAELDERLADELRAMADKPRLGADWARLEFLPAIRTRLGSHRPAARPPRWSPIAGVAGIVALLLLLVGVAVIRPTGSLPGGPYGETRDGDFTLTISADEPFYAPGEAMRVVASLTYEGEEAVVRLSGVEHLIAGFGARQLDGPLAMGPGWDEPCLRHELRKGESVRREFAKSASWAADDPNADFYRQWSTDPQLWLPAGHWELTAIADFSTGEDCGTGAPVRLQATIEVEVRDDGASPAPAPTPPSTWASLNTSEFAARVAAGELGGEVVPVLGEIVPGPPRRGPACTPGDLCGFGQLAGVAPPLEIYARAVPTIESDAATHIQGEAGGWEWWRGRNLPTGAGRFLLKVLDDGTVEYLGYEDAEHPWGLSSLATVVKPENAPLDEVVMVPGWLIGTATTSCPAPNPDTYIADLPGRYCTPQAWIGPDPARPHPFDAPRGAVQVQSGAYTEFAATDHGATAPEPVPGLWALARRLEGSGCPDDSPPCWRWNLIAKVTYEEPGPATPVESPDATEEPTASPTPDATPKPRSSPAPQVGQPTLLTCSRADGQRDLPPAQLTDYSGAVAACAVGRGTPGQTSTSVSNPDGDLHRLQVEWGAPMCLRGLTAELADVDADGTVIVVLDSQGTNLESACPAAPSRPALVLSMNRPVAADRASVYLMYDGRVVASTDTSVGSFSLTLDRGRREYAAGEPIEIEGALVYSGAAETVVVSGLPSALGVFSFEQLDGELEMSRFVSRVPCVGFDLRAGEPVRSEGSPLRGLIFEDDGPNAAFYRRWRESDELWLPAGIWKVSIGASFAVGPQGCGDEEVALQASVILIVR